MLEEKKEIDEFEKEADNITDTPKKKKKLPGWVIIPILAGIVLVVVVASKFANTGSKAVALDVIKIENGDVKEVFNTSGTVESEKEKVFYAPVNAPISTCTAKVGASVKAGDLLVTFDTKDLEKNNQESQLNALSTQYANQSSEEQASRGASEAAKAQKQSANKISSLQSEISEDEKELAKLKEAETNASAAIQEAQKQKEELETNLTVLRTQKTEQETVIANLEDEIAHIDALYPEETQDNKNKIIQEKNQKIQAARKTRDKLERDINELTAKLSSIGDVGASGQGASAALEDQLAAKRAQLKELQNTPAVSADTGLTSGQIKSMQVSENLTELATLSAEELLAKGREGLKAEFDGVIADVKTKEGGAATQGLELFTLASNTEVGVKLEVSANDFEKLKIGNKATVKVGDFSYEATIQTIDKIAVKNEKGNPVIGAKVHIDNADENIYIGVPAKVSMTVAEKKNVLNLPNEVVNMSANGDFVYVIQNGIVKKQVVELGVTSSTSVEVKSGLAKGDQVVKDTSGKLKEGMKATAVVVKSNSK